MVQCSTPEDTFGPEKSAAARDVEFIAGRAFDGCDEFVVVVVDDRLLLGGADRGVSQLVKAGREPHDGIDNRESTFVNDQRIRQVRK